MQNKIKIHPWILRALYFKQNILNCSQKKKIEKI